MGQNKRFKIWFFPRWYPDRSDTMFGLFVQRHAQAISITDDVFVLYITPSSICKENYEIAELHVNGITEIICYYKKYHGLFESIINFYKYIIGTFKVYHYCRKKYGISDINHVHILTRTSILPYYLKIKNKIPYIITEHWSRYLPENIKTGSYKGILRKFFTRLFVYNSFAVTTVTKNLGDAMKMAGLNSKKYLVIPNVADSKAFYPSTEKNNSRVKKLIHISCFDEKAKNVKGIIDVISELWQERSDFTMQIIGDGPDYNDVFEYSASKNIPKNVLIFAGLVEGEELAKTMRESDLFVMFSNYENLPCTIVESMTSGVPVISTDVGGIREFVPEYAGSLISKANKSELKQAIVSAMDNPTSFDKQKTREYALNTFSNEAISIKFHTLYSEVQNN